MLTEKGSDISNKKFLDKRLNALYISTLVIWANNIPLMFTNSLGSVQPISKQEAFQSSQMKTIPAVDLKYPAMVVAVMR